MLPRGDDKYSESKVDDKEKKKTTETKTTTKTKTANWKRGQRLQMWTLWSDLLRRGGRRLVCIFTKLITKLEFVGARKPQDLPSIFKECRFP